MSTENNNNNNMTELEMAQAAVAERKARNASSFKLLSEMTEDDIKTETNYLRSIGRLSAIITLEG